MPDAGESEAQDGRRFPSVLSKSGAIKKAPDDFTYLDPAQFHDLFAADLSAEQAAFMAQSQVFNLAENFPAMITAPAWFCPPCYRHLTGLASPSILSSNGGTPRAPRVTPVEVAQAQATWSTGLKSPR